jgi:branched-chain amino acid transport system ATP-binding protein
MTPVQNLVAGYGSIRVLRGVDLVVRRGEVVALLGANGSGKSTLLNAISGFIRPRAGRIRLEGQEIAGRPPHWTFRRGVVQVSQGRDLFPDMSVEENLALGAAVRGDVRAGLPRTYELVPRLAARQRQTCAAVRRRAADGGDRPGAMSDPRSCSSTAVGRPRPVFVAEIGRIVERLQGGRDDGIDGRAERPAGPRRADRFVALRDGVVLAHGPVSDLRGGVRGPRAPHLSVAGRATDASSSRPTTYRVRPATLDDIPPSRTSVRDVRGDGASIASPPRSSMRPSAGISPRPCPPAPSWPGWWSTGAGSWRAGVSSSARSSRDRGSCGGSPKGSW